MKIATYNLRHGGSEIQWQTIRTLDPDILLLQEFNADKYTPSGQLCFSRVAHNRWGSAIWCKQGLLEPIQVPEFEGWVVGAEINQLEGFEPVNRPLRLFSIHAPTPYAKQVNKILDWLGKMADECDLVIGGDFNLTVGIRHESEPKDYDAKLLARFRREFGLINCWQTANPNRNLPQTLRWSGDKTKPYHCDGIFVPAFWYRYLESCEVLSDETWHTFSDHNPVVATFSRD